MTTPQVLLGEYNYYTAGETDMQRMNVMKIKEHPDYNDWTGNNDFALLKLKKAVDYCAHPHIRPVCLPTDTSQTFAGVEAILTGWGTKSSGGLLLEVTVAVVTNEECKKKYRDTKHFITGKMLCASVEGGPQDSCQVIILRTGWAGCPEGCPRETQVDPWSLPCQTATISR